MTLGSGFLLYLKKHKKKTPRARTRSVEMKNPKSYHT